ncbi:hypothetical protein SVIO_055330 [Streptomyces violaceusniger]|uniref:CBM-cenC domain-containing protein n=1 Tax=Streptomyces violaceusniger TaxID=68280 RepID=A0A4D4L7C5_STRVO|nr:hypothetical protein SVIO_055330 [Streptomyces violaceusniger]
MGQNDIPLRQGTSYTLSFSASASRPVTVKAQVQLSKDPYTATFTQDIPLDAEQRYTFTFSSTLDTEYGQVSFHIGGDPEPWVFRLDDVSLLGGDPLPRYVPDTGSRVRVNQVGYLPFGPKRATVVTDAAGPVPWQVNNRDGVTVASGTSTPRGSDTSSGQRVHTVDFGEVTEAGAGAGAGYTLTADGQTSYPFDISPTLYDQLRSDALHFFYVQRSGIPISDELAPGYGRPAGHIGVPPNTGDTHVPCRPGEGDYALDVRGGWYDAGDHGKYVVNGGIAVYQLLSEYERTRTAPGRARTGWATASCAFPSTATAYRTSWTRRAGSWSSCCACRCRSASPSRGWPTTRCTTTSGPVCRCPRTGTTRRAICIRRPRRRRSTWRRRPRRPPGCTRPTTRASPRAA